ncbi:hypothetical protein RchiOBHm_Chr5g0000821 [Rosa chinensis]|uniref:Uncharacterized protein n=1 Tax=Rosa chinensis TaxID=74649 RepID=A0A2P6Q210_ROSCH|nr:hypothetical protein RchiOBHm_Chr5g0000821 [Rosa chinensis]
MGKDISNDGIVVVRSSIALLQERFRELQRVKVMREQREVLRRLALSEPNHSMNYEPEAARLLFHPNAHDHDVQLAHGHESSSSSPLSLWPTLQLQKRKREEEYYTHWRRRKIINEIPLINLWPTVTDTSSSSSSSVETCSLNKLETSECDFDYVDTSLHL